jgi:hypothetical protein
MTFVRRFTSDPGNEVIEQIEGIVLISRDPPAQVSGVFAGTVMLLGEFEDGPFNLPTEIENGGDLLANFGGFGFTYEGLPSCNPCARARFADSAITPEYWNGNAFIWLSQKKFGGLIVVRADTSVGTVEVTRQAQVTGNNDSTWELVTGQTVVAAVNATLQTATFTAAIAVLTSAAGVYPTTFAGGESMNVTIDEGTDFQIGPIDIVFQVGDQAHADVIARINTTLGYVAAADGGGGTTTLSGRVQGTRGRVNVNSVSGVLVTTATGFSAPTAANGTGNVANILEVTLSEAKAVIEAGVVGSRVERDSNGSIRIVSTGTDRMMYDVGNSTAEAFGFGVSGADFVASSAAKGFAVFLSTAGTYPTTFAGGESLTLGFDNAPDILVVFTAGDQSQAQVIARINSIAGYPAASSFSGTVLQLSGRVNGGQVRVVSASGLVLSALGLVVPTLTVGVPTADTIVPAGFRFRNAAADEWVSMQTQKVAANNAGPYSLKVRPANDDDTASLAAADTVTVMVDLLPGLALGATNPSQIDAALSEPAIDSRYDDAFASTLAQSSVAKLANGVFAARQSNALRNGLRADGLTASGSGMTGRISVIRPPLGTTRTTAKSGVQQPGVGRYRSANNGYAYPGLQIRIPQIAARGTSGGAGFTADGIIDVGSDVLVATLMSQLAPEENIGQATDIPSWALGLEAGNADVQNMDINDYIAFKAAGIMAPVFDGGACEIQSAVTTVDPLLSPELADFARQRFEYFIQDSLKTRLKAFNKKKMTAQRRADCLGEIGGFMTGLVSSDNPANQRIDSFLIDAKSGNSKASLARGQFRIILRVRMLPDMKFIVLETIVGTNVETTVTVLQQAA